MKEGDDRIHLGFSAQDIEAILGNKYSILGRGEDKDHKLSLRYTDFIAPLVKAVQEQQVQISKYESQLSQQQAQISEQQAQIVALQRQLETVVAALNGTGRHLVSETESGHSERAGLETKEGALLLVSSPR